MDTRGIFGWVRVLPGMPPNCGVVRFSLQLGSQDGGQVYRIGVIPATNTRPITDTAFFTHHKGCNVWFIQDDAVFCNGSSEAFFSPCCMEAGDIVSVEIERGPSESVMRLKVDGRPGKMARGLPNTEELYLVVRLCNVEQSYTLLP